MIQVNRFVYWFAAILGCFVVLSLMNNRFVHSMIYPAPAVRVPDKPPVSFKEPEWDLEIHGWLYEPQTLDSRQVLLYFHGNGENLETLRQSGFLEELKRFKIPFLVVDYPGYGRSKGKASESTILDSGLAAARWLKARYPDHALILCGWSLGASVAVQTAANAKEADALIAMSVWTSLRDVALLHFSEWLVGWTLTDRYDAVKAAHSIRMPALFIHGESDDLIPASQGKRVAQTIQTASWVELRSVGHNDLLSQPEVWKEIDQFLNQLRINASRKN